MMVPTFFEASSTVLKHLLSLNRVSVLTVCVVGHLFTMYRLYRRLLISGN